jgi:hypothetical protein
MEIAPLGHACLQHQTPVGRLQFPHWLLAHTQTVRDQNVHFGYAFLLSVLRRPPLAMHDGVTVAP